MASMTLLLFTEPKVRVSVIAALCLGGTGFLSWRKVQHLKASEATARTEVQNLQAAMEAARAEAQALQVTLEAVNKEARTMQEAVDTARREREAECQAAQRAHAVIEEQQRRLDRIYGWQKSDFNQQSLMTMTISDLEFLDRRWTGREPEHLGEVRRERVPWRLSGPGCTLENVNHWFWTLPRLFLMGPHKVGKTSFVGWLSDRNLNIGSQDVHTRGLNFHIEPVMNRQMLFIDTEGMFQPIDDESPKIKQELLFRFMTKTCDHLIFVMDRMNIQDMKQLQRVRRYFGSSKQMRLTVIHNLKSVKSDESLKSYRDLIKANLGCEYVEDNAYCLQSSVGNRGRQLTMKHYFFGDKTFMSNDEALRDLRLDIASCSPSPMNFGDVFKESVSYVFSRFFEPHEPVVLEWSSDNELHVTNMEVNSLTRRQCEVGTSMESMFDMYTEFDPSDADKPEVVLTVIVDVSGVLPEDVSVEIGDANTLNVTVSKRTFLRTTPASLFQSLEIPYDIRKDAAAKAYLSSHKHFDSTANILSFKLLLSAEWPEIKAQIEKHNRWG